MKRLWKMKHYEFEDFTRDESGMICEGSNTLTKPAMEHIEEFVCRVLDPIWEAWDRNCVFRGWETGISIRRAFIRKGICDTLPAEYRDYYRGYTAEIYPTNGRMEDFIYFMKLVFSHPRMKFDEVSYNPKDGEYMRVIFKSSRGERRNIINL